MVSGFQKAMYRNSATLNLSVLGVTGACVCVCVCVLSRVQLFCDPVDYSRPAFSVHTVFQARGPEWAAIFSSTLRGWKRLNQGWHQPSIHKSGRPKALLSCLVGQKSGQARLNTPRGGTRRNTLPPAALIQSPPASDIPPFPGPQTPLLAAERADS